ncbi:hypothetical protein RRG08_057104, partial [Elysia crispata]
RSWGEKAYRTQNTEGYQNKHNTPRGRGVRKLTGLKTQRVTKTNITRQEVVGEKAYRTPKHREVTKTNITRQEVVGELPKGTNKQNTETPNKHQQKGVGNGFSDKLKVQQLANKTQGYQNKHNTPRGRGVRKLTGPQNTETQRTEQNRQKCSNKHNIKGIFIKIESKSYTQRDETNSKTYRGVTKTNITRQEVVG